MIFAFSIASVLPRSRPIRTKGRRIDRAELVLPLGKEGLACGARMRQVIAKEGFITGRISRALQGCRPLWLGIAMALFAAMPGMAETGSRMSPDEFEAYVTGRTLVYNSAGQPYGIEEYLPGRRVRWAFSGDDCVEGYWYVEAELICFAYENNLEPQCWSFEHSPNGLIARFNDSGDATQLYETRQSSQPMACFGPKVGS